MWYQREIFDRIRIASEKFPIVVITGARQVGKTALLQKRFPNHTYISLDIPSAAALAEKAPSEFFGSLKTPAIIDEVQYAPGLFRHLKTEVDKERHAMGRYILTGSQKFSLMKEVSESLAGRAAIIELETLSAHEITEHQPRPTDASAYEQLMVRGGFPELWRDTDIPLDMFFSSYLSTYLERDVRQLLNVTSLRSFERFIRACAARNGQTLHKTALAGDVGISVTTVSEWLSVLEASNQIILLEPWYTNLGKRIVKSPKLYLSDSGLLSYLIGVTEKTVSKSPFVGAVWECYIFSELRKRLKASGSRKTIWFYRDKQQLEVDFLLVGGGEASLIECKWTECPQKSDVKNVIKLLNLIETKRIPELSYSNGYVASRTPEPFPITDRIRAVNLLTLPFTPNN